MRNILLALAALAVAGFAALSLVTPAVSQTTGWQMDCLDTFVVEPITGGNRITCGTIITPTATLAPTATNTPQPTATPNPTPTPTSPSSGVEFSAGIELNGPISGGSDMVNLFNPAGSGKNLYLKYLQQGGLGTSAHYDIWITNAVGCTTAMRDIQIKPADFREPEPVSVAIADSRCTPKPSNDAEWFDGPYRQFTVDASEPVVDLSSIVIPPGRGITIRNDPDLPAGSVVFFHLVWEEG